MKKFIIVLSVLTLFIAAMFAEYRYIMVNICPYIDGDIVYLEIFGQIDEYEAEFADVLFD